jgi:hypothetical protein
MVIIFKEIIICPKNMEKVCMFGQVKIANTKEISEKIFYKVKLNCIFRIVSFILERSKMEKEMDKEGIIIKMVTNFKVSGKMILNQ